MFFSPQNSILAIAGDDESVRLHDMSEKKMVCEFKAHETRWVCFPDAFNLLRHISPRCVSSVLGLQSKSDGQFCHGRLLRDGDGF